MSVFGTERQRRELAGRLALLRAASGMSGRELGRQVGVDQSTISRIERGTQRVSLPQVIAWAKATDAPEDQQAQLLTLAEEIADRIWSVSVRVSTPAANASASWIATMRGMLVKMITAIPAAR